MEDNTTVGKRGIVIEPYNSENEPSIPPNIYSIAKKGLKENTTTTKVVDITENTIIFNNMKEDEYYQTQLLNKDIDYITLFNFDKTIGYKFVITDELQANIVKMMDAKKLTYATIFGQLRIALNPVYYMDFSINPNYIERVGDMYITFKPKSSTGGKKNQYTVKQLKSIALIHNIKTTKKLNGKIVNLKKDGLIAKLKKNKVI
jgi:hypothetical protein